MSRKSNAHRQEDCEDVHVNNLQLRGIDQVGLPTQKNARQKLQSDEAQVFFDCGTMNQIGDEIGISDPGTSCIARRQGAPTKCLSTTRHPVRPAAQSHSNARKAMPGRPWPASPYLLSMLQECPGALALRRIPRGGWRASLRAIMFLLCR
jgi:hypothetical protein